MKRLVLLLALGLGWVVYDRSQRARPVARGDEAYPFPTADAHAAIPVDSDMAAWCDELGCSDADLRDAIDTVGRSVDAVRDHLARRANAA